MPLEQGINMDGVRELLTELRQHGHAQGRFLGLLNVFIGRRIEAANGEMLCNGLTWREMAELLKKVRWEKAAVDELAIDAASLSPRDRVRYWNQAIARARVDSNEATKAGDQLAEILGSLGYKVGPPPREYKGV
jgi:hypothetical protein